MTHHEALKDRAPGVPDGDCDGALRPVTRREGDRRRVCVLCGTRLGLDDDGRVVWASHKGTPLVEKGNGHGDC